MNIHNPGTHNIEPYKKTKSFNLKHYLYGVLTGVIIITAMNSTILYYMSQRSAKQAAEPNASIQAQSMQTNISDEGKKLNKIFSILDNYYVDKYDRSTMLETMYQALVYDVGDPYTTYMSADTFTKFLEDTEGIYAGIGVSVSVDTTDNSILVITPFEGYPGARAGILPGDKIIKVNDYEVSGDTIDEAVSIMKGTEGTSVKVTLYRPSQNTTIDLEIVREKINVPTVSHKMLENDIAYIRITQFDRVTYDQFRLAYDELKPNMKGLIIDLRNNPGGLLNIVTDITDLLVPEGTIVYTEDKYGKKIYTKSDKTQIEVPLLVLVNGYSASASEVLSGAVKDMGIGQLVGSQTFGKGLVQNIYEIGDGSAVKVTIAKYYTPSGVCIQGEGIAPDYPIDMADELTVKISSLSLDEDVQLRRALEVMNEKIAR